jgi:hypothetical protein
MNKKGITWSYIVAGALAIIVLVVMATVFTDNAGKNTGVFSDCGNKGGECISSKDCSDKDGFSLNEMSCKKEEICCVLEKDK